MKTEYTVTAESDKTGTQFVLAKGVPRACIASYMDALNERVSSGGFYHGVLDEIVIAIWVSEETTINNAGFEMHSRSVDRAAQDQIPAL